MFEVNKIKTVKSAKFNLFLAIYLYTVAELLGERER